MSISPFLPGLTIESPLAVPGAINFRPPTWPPTADWPIVVDKEGRVLSRFSDSVWILDPWANRRMVLNFGDGPRKGKRPPIDKGNADLLRIAVSWWLYGPSDVYAATTILNRFAVLRPIIVICAAEGILASELNRYPVIAEKIGKSISPSIYKRTISLLHETYESREKIGFCFLDRAGIAKLASMFSDHETKQTPYIPPRIWQYQVSQLQNFLEDILAHTNEIQACFDFCLTAYIQNYGSLQAALTSGRNSKLRPFGTPTREVEKQNGLLFHGSFQATAEKFNLDQLFRKWCGLKNDPDTFKLPIDYLSNLFSMVIHIGLAYIANFSLMRRAEAGSLRTDCLRIETDPEFGNIYLLQGPTTKTVTDDRAIWVTSPNVLIAVQALTVIAQLREKCVVTKTEGPLLLNIVATEPWAAGAVAFMPNVPKILKSYSIYTSLFPKLFDLDELRIKPRDLELARLANPTLPTKFKVGSVWSLGWHQLRRTGAINMQASGLVSDSSVQFQLKHATRAMSLYYGQNYSRIRLEKSSKTLYIQTMYETLGRELAKLTQDRFISPHGDRRKAEIVRLISTADVKQSVKLAKEGGAACREIVLGVCTNREPCPYGGIDSVAHCGGGDADDAGKNACADVLYDKTKRTLVEKLERTLNERLSVAPAESPLYESLKSQKRSVENYYHAIEEN